jgi:hypothetical protein
MNYVDGKTTTGEAIANAFEAPVYFTNESKLNQKAFYDAMDNLKKENQVALDKVRPIYDQIQKLKISGNVEQANQMAQSLSPADYAVYKKIKQSEKSKVTIKGEKEIYPIYLKIKELKDSGQIDAANAMARQLTADQYKVYKLVKDKFE